MATCNSAAGQLLSLPAPGTAGPILLFGGSVCLDDFGAAGKVGDVVGIYTCAAGAPSQRWVLTGAGEVRGINDLCLNAGANGVTLQTCTGGGEQKFTVAGTPSAPITSPSYMVFYGSSTTQGVGASNLATKGYVGLTVADPYFSGWLSANQGAGGQELIPSVAGIVADAATRVAAGRRWQVAVVMHGSNDLYNRKPAADVYASLLSLTSQLRAQGWKVVWITPQSRSGLGTAERHAYSNLLASGFAAGHADGFADVRSDPLIGGDNSYLSYAHYSDGTHFNDAGHARLATVVKAALVSMLERGS
jgi:lysophospholipase L1-like esterase